MLTSSESSGNEVIALLADTPPVGTDQGLTPKGPTGLLRALVDASAAREAGERGLPTMDAHAVGAGRLAVRLRRRARAGPRRSAPGHLSGTAARRFLGVGQDD